MPERGGGADSCCSDYAQTNAEDLMDLLTGIDADVDPPRSEAPDSL